jgi:isoleucyl-tRNA synthetase
VSSSSQQDGRAHAGHNRPERRTFEERDSQMSPTRVGPFALSELEERVLARWDQIGLPHAVDAQRATAPRWSFYEGPPTANGRPGVHHVWARGFKDLYMRFKTQQGYQVPRKGGWDCHGLPVEIEVEKELGLKSKLEIEAYGVEKFNERCRTSVQRYVGDWKALSQRAGIWIDMDSAYWTMSNDYIESVWWLLSDLAKRGLMYEGHRVVPYCGRCGTALSSHELGQPEVYRDVVEAAVKVRLPILEEDGPLAGADLLVWTTTPWTLVSNVAVAVNPTLTYVRVPASAFGDPAGRDVVLAEGVLPEEARELAGVRVSGEQLVGLRYRRPFEDLTPLRGIEKAWQVYPASFVEADEGTGLVHIAPAFGEADAELARQFGLPLLNPVDSTASFGDELPQWKGRFVKDADPVIIQALRQAGLLFEEHEHSHSYPHCWRCQTPLIYWAKESWFLKTSEQRDTLVAQNQKVDWHPPSIKDGRFGNWLANNVDWALSRDRYWGTPLPVWRCSGCHTDTWISSLEDLRKLSGRPLENLDLHRPAIDEVQLACPECGGQATRLLPVIDAWFDSGAMPAAQFHYPFENTAEFEKSYPADFICEGIDQTRGWFYSLLAVNSLEFGTAPYRNVLCLALVVDENGRKMSKSRGNALDPYGIFRTLGADALRWFFFSQGQPWTSRRISEEAIRSSSAETLGTLWNVFSFHQTYAELEGWAPKDDQPARGTSVLDRWVLSELDDTVSSVTAALERFDSFEAARRLMSFVDDLSNWYVRRSRSRYWKGDETAFSVLHDCLVTTATLLAPFCPMLADEIFAQLTGKQSVHLADWPTEHGRYDAELARSMRAGRRIVALGRTGRVEAAVKTRQPLQRALLIHPGAALSEDVLAEIASELNVKSIERIETVSAVTDWLCVPNFRALGPRVGAGIQALKQALASADGSELKREMDQQGHVTVGGVRLEPGDVEFRPIRREGFALAAEGEWAVALDLELSPELIAEGKARELIRAVNDLRKSLDFEITDRVVVDLDVADSTREQLAPHLPWIAEEVLATRVAFGAGQHEIDLNGDPGRVSLALAT